MRKVNVEGFDSGSASGLERRGAKRWLLLLQRQIGGERKVRERGACSGRSAGKETFDQITLLFIRGV